LFDTVCVTANPWYLNVDGVQVHAMIPLVGDEYRDEETGAIMPETVSRNAKKAAEEYPNKRLVVHYMQPHTPYIGPTGRKHFDGFRTRSDLARKDGVSDSFDVEKLRTAYRENLEIIRDEITDLLDVLTGKTVISADHGEMFGERHFPIPMRDYMHPHGSDIEVLTKVPWHVRDSDDRRRILSEKPQAKDEDRVMEIDSSAVKEQLEELGYLQ
jgi:hypothetical protein